MPIRPEFRPASPAPEATVTSGVMAVAIILMRGWLGASLLDAGLMARIGMILLIVFVSMAVYFAIALASGALPRRKLMRLAGGG